MDFAITITAITGLILFLFGIENFSKEIQNAAGDKFRKLLSKFTSNRVSGTLLGAGVTAVVQSSSATTVIAVGLVNAGVISFANSLGIILGSNIGTTITAQLIAFKLTAFAPVFIIAGFLISIFGKRHKIIGKGMFYFGIVFFSLGLISSIMEPLKNDPFVMSWFSQLSNIFIALIVGFVFTIIVQSSSVTTGIVVVLAGSGIIGLLQGIPILLGANIGTTVTSLIASARFNLYAKRVAMAHLIFNVVGALLLLLILYPFVDLITNIGGTTAQQVANAHTIFNIGAAVVFLIFFKQYKYLVEKLVKGTEKEILLRPKYLIDKLPENNKKAVEFIEKEIRYSLHVSSQMFKKAKILLHNPSAKESDRLQRYGNLNDLLDKTIEKALVELSRGKLGNKESESLILLVRISNLIEQLGDSADDLGSLSNEVSDLGRKPSLESKKSLDEIVKVLRGDIKNIEKNFPHKKIVKKLRTKKLRKTLEKLFKEHFLRIKERGNYPGSIFVEAVSILEQSFNKIDEIVTLTEKYNNVRKKLNF